LAGCGPESDSGSSAFNPAQPVFETFESFEVQDDGGNPYVSRTIFYDLYRGLEPESDGEDRGAASGLRERLGLLMGLTPNGDGTSYTAARNPFDFIHYLINTDRIGTFNDGKRLMRDSVTRKEPATYNTPAKNALIQFIDLAGTDGSSPDPDQLWIYPLLDWTSNFTRFEPRTARVFRSVQFIARPPEDGDPNPAELKSGFWSGEFAGDSFSSSGYNAPNYFAFSATGRQYGDLEFYSVLVNPQYDTLILRDTSGITIDGQEPAFICAQIDYEDSETRIVYVVDPDGDTGEGSTDPAQCPNVGNAFVYQSAVINSRQ